MSNKHLSLRPHHIPGRKDIWWYDEIGGINVISEWRDGDRYIQTDSIKIRPQRQSVTANG